MLTFQLLKSGEVKSILVCWCSEHYLRWVGEHGGSVSFPLTSKQFNIFIPTRSYQYVLGRYPGWSNIGVLFTTTNYSRAIQWNEAQGFHSLTGDHALVMEDVSEKEQCLAVASLDFATWKQVVYGWLCLSKYEITEKMQPCGPRSLIIDVRLPSFLWYMSHRFCHWLKFELVFCLFVTPKAA